MFGGGLQMPYVTKPYAAREGARILRVVTQQWSQVLCVRGYGRGYRRARH
jgi:hypothetical protein